MYPDGLMKIGRCARLTIHAVVVFVMFLCASALFVSCPSRTVIREASVYKAEVDFMDDASAEQVEHAIDVLRESCDCKDGLWTTKACEELAETTVVMQARMPYHAEYMRYLAGIIDEKPPEDPPEIPPDSSLCPDEKLEIPVLESDGGLE